MFWNSPYFQNVASDFITLALLLGIGGVAYRVTNRQRLVSFFRCASERTVVVYLSNLVIEQWHSKDMDGSIRSYHGSAVPAYELDLVAPAFALFLAPVPGLEGQRGLLGALALRDILVRVAVSPGEVADVQQSGTLIVLGSSGYNVAARLAEVPASQPFATLDPRGYIDLAHGRRGDLAGADIAMIQKLYHAERGQWIFHVAGPTRAGTICAYFYLLNRWKSLAREFGPAVPFVKVLRVSEIDVANPQVVYSAGGVPPDGA
ncbi:hypothetical protein [Actinomycetospora aeridis]|uniref:Uncharacterized protein n=1 Tax=Actinomycetospora aeridis TaxID=3129231 RepID=A0ABU8N5P6_9PSEU